MDALADALNPCELLPSKALFTLQIAFDKKMVNVYWV